MSAADVLAQHSRRVDFNHPAYGKCRCGIDPDDLPGEMTHADHQLDALKAAGYAVVELPKQLPSEHPQRGFELPGTDLSVRYRDYGDQGDEFQLWVDSPTRPSRIQKVYDAEVGRDLAALILAVAAAEGEA